MSEENQVTQDIPIHFYSRANHHCPAFLLDLEYFVKQVEMPLLIQELVEQEAESEAQERTILIVDSDSESLERHVQLVQSISQQYAVLRASDKHQALAILKQTRPDLIILDLQIPESNGFAVLEVLQSDESLTPIPVIALTARVQTEMDLQHLHTGVVTVLSIYQGGKESTTPLSCVKSKNIPVKGTMLHRDATQD